MQSYLRYARGGPSPSGTFSRARDAIRKKTVRNVFLKIIIFVKPARCQANSRRCEPNDDWQRGLQDEAQLLDQPV